MTRHPPSPPRLARLLLSLRPLGIRRRDVEADLRELFEHRAITTGLSDARRRFYVDVFSLWIRGQRVPARTPWPSRMPTLASVGRDLIYGARLFRHHPALVAVTVLGLAIAIAIATTAFTYLDVALFRPFGVADPDTLMKVMRQTPASRRSISSWASADARVLLASSHTSLVAVTTADSVPLTADPGVEARDDAGDVWYVTPGFFELMGGGTVLGRTLGPADDVRADVPPVVLGHTYWIRHLGGDPGVIGRRLWLNDRQVIVVGVANRTFTGPSVSDTIPMWARPVAVWTPYWAFERLHGATPRTATVFARLAPDTSADVAAAELTSIATSMTVAAIGGGERLPISGIALQPAGHAKLDERDVEPFWILVVALAGLVVLILLLACANAANLLLASAITRQREIGVRLALGASRARVVRQLLTESVLLSALSAAAGLVLAVWAIQVLATLSGVDPAIDVSLDVSVYLFVAALVFVVGLAAGLAPARHGTRGDLATPLKGDAGGSAMGGTRAGRLRLWLVGGQAAASCLLLTIAALLVRTALQVTTVDTGLPIDRLLIARPNFTRAYDAPARAAEYWRVAEGRLRALPAVERAAVTEVAPFMWSSKHVEVLRSAAPYKIEYYPATPEFLDVLGLRLVRGRAWTRTEVATRARVAVISETLAREFWPDANPIGDRLARMGVPASQLTRAGLVDDAEIIGVVSDAIVGRLAGATTANVYLPLAAPSAASLLIRTRGDAGDLAGIVHDALRAIDPTLRPSTWTVASRLDIAIVGPRDTALAATAIGALALCFAVVGIFGVTAFIVGQRRREIGLRMALGARPRDVFRQVLRESLKPVAIGAVVGLGGAIAAGQALGSMLHGLSGLDPLAYLAALLLLLIAACLAVAAPTHRAASADPSAALRQ